MTTQIKTWGNSQGIRFSKEIMAISGFETKDVLDMEVKSGIIILRKKEKTHRTLEERAQEYGGRLGPYTEFDWGEPVGREVV